MKEVLQGLLNPADKDALELRRRIRQVWEAVLPANLRQHARLADLKRKELWVEVTAHSWAQELQFLRPRILEEMARVLGPGKIKDLRVRVAEL